MTNGQRRAIEELQVVAEANPEALEIVDIRERDDSRFIEIDVSVGCAGIEHHAAGIRLREREPLTVYVGPMYPWKPPSAHTIHRRWAGTPHVQWGRSLCLYQATSIEWNPSAGMRGFLRRLALWLERAAAGDLDPAGAPLHPPAIYLTGAGPRLVVRADTPPVTPEAWIGLAEVEGLGSSRVNVDGWTSLEEGRSDALDGRSCPAILLPSALDWEYPQCARHLLDALHDRGVSWKLLLAILKLGAALTPKDLGMPFLLGTPMRRGLAGDPEYHLAAWYLRPTIVDALRLALETSSENEALQEIGARAEEIIRDWSSSARLDWSRVHEMRPGLVERRDSQSAVMEAFADKAVVIWGAGAIGAHAAEWIARAGAREVSIYDLGPVGPGILVRQPFLDADVGKPKAEVLAARLRAIRPDLHVTWKQKDVLSDPLERSDYTDGADILIDATASVAVASKLEAVRRAEGARGAAIASLLLGYEAERGLAAVALADHSGGPLDVVRQLRLAAVSLPGLGGFAEEFWPKEPRTEHFQPEPGCSDVTFRGSGAEVGALTGALLVAVAKEFAAAVSEPVKGTRATAVGHLIALPTAVHEGRRQVRLIWPADVVVRDGLDRYEVRISQRALAGIRTGLRRNARVADAAAETGGALFGQRDLAAGVVWVDTAALPPPDSVASDTQFVCGTAGVREEHRDLSQRTSGASAFIGMWHTHPVGNALPSPRDVAGMSRLVAVQPDADESLMLIIGAAEDELELQPTRALEGDDELDLGAYVFSRKDLPRPFGLLTIHDRRVQVPTRAPMPVPPADRRIGLALSGGGSRAVAFHLGCLRALHDRGLLGDIRAISGVSGGAVATAAFAYGPAEFAEFDRTLVALLRRGLQWEIARRALLSPRAVESLLARLISTGATVLARLMDFLGGDASRVRVRRWRSRTQALEDTLSHRLVGERTLDADRRGDVDVVLNACDLRTGSAVRFGSRESGTWRIGRIVDPVRISRAVAASAAYPLLLPSLDSRWRFQLRRGGHASERMLLSDGGVFDNLGTSCFDPERSEEFSYNVFHVPYVIACDAGRGLLGDSYPVEMVGRTARSFTATHRKAQDASRARLHALSRAGDLAGFAMPYLGQRDEELPRIPPDLVRRKEVASYPTNFASMSPEDLAALTRRGERLTHLLLDRWCPGLLPSD